MPSFTDQDWNLVLTHMTQALGSAETFSTSVAARLMAAIPYLSGSEDPDRFAVSNLMTLHAARKIPELFAHRSSDDEDLYRHLATFHVGNHADPRLVDYGLTLLAWLALGDRATSAHKGELIANLNRSSWLRERFAAAVGTDLVAGLEEGE